MPDNEIEANRQRALNDGVEDTTAPGRIAPVSQRGDVQMTKKNDVGLYYLNDPDRIKDASDFIASELRAFILEPLSEVMIARGPHCETLTVGETELAIIRALAIVQLEAGERFAGLGYESMYDFDEAA